MDAPKEDRLLVSEIYPTVQGESTLVGTPTVFVRLYTCNLRCAWCDSMHAVEGGVFEELSVAEVQKRILTLAGEHAPPLGGIRHVCWTGGEPLLQARAVARVIRELPALFLHSFETDGEVLVEPFLRDVETARREGRVKLVMDVKCPGSRMTAQKAFENLRHLTASDEVKFVLLDRGDYDFAKRVLREHPIPAGVVLFSPVTPAHHVKTGLDAATLAAWILEDRLNVRLQPQVHKMVWPGRERGI